MIFPKLRRRRSSSEGSVRRTERNGSRTLLPGMPLDGGVVSCQVQDEQGHLVEEAEVTVVDRLNRQLAHGTTDSYGFFLATVPPGPHRVAVNAGGYKRVSTRAEVRVGQHTSVDGIQLEPDSSLALPQPGTWRFDVAHTEVRFVAQHIGMSKIHGRFNSFDGHIRVAPQFEHSRIEAVIDADSIDTGIEARDKHLRSPDFLDVDNYPKLSFTSDRIFPMRGDKWLINGSLSLRGTTSPVDLDTTYLGLRSWNGTRAAALVRTELRREDYAVNWQQTLAKGIAVVGPTVQIELDLQAVLDE